MKIYKLGQLPAELYPAAGGKAKGLDQLTRHGFRIPEGFVITDTEEIDRDKVYEAFDALKAQLVSVRSSASNEDAENASNAGQYETCLFVDRQTLMPSIQKCLDSLKAERVKDYADHFELGSARMNIVVQEMIDSRKAGVMFTASPERGCDILIEAVSGQGENLVSGKVSAHRYRISRKCYRPCADELLTEDEVKLLYQTGKNIRETFGRDMDVEWAIRDGELYLLQMRPITTEIIDIEEFDRADDISTHLFTRRNVGEMMPGAVTPLTLSTSAKAIDYGMRYMLYLAGVYKSPYEEAPLRLISSISGHLFFDMQLLYNMHAKVGIARPQQMNLSIMGEYHDHPPVTVPYAGPLARAVNSVKFLKYVFSGRGAGKKFDRMLTKVHFTHTESCRELYGSIDANMAFLDESLIYHYASSSYSGSATSTLYMMVDKYFPDKKEYQSFLSHLLTNIPGIESADILMQLQEMAKQIKALSRQEFDAEGLLQFIRATPEINASYKRFLERHGHRCIKEAEMRNKPWREDQISLMNYLLSIIRSPKNLIPSEDEIDLKKEFAFIKNPLLRAAAISYGKKCRQGVVDRESTKSRLILLIDMFKTQYALLAGLMVKDGILSDADLIYFLTHEEIGLLLDGDQALAEKAAVRRKAHAIQDGLSFDDIYIGKPVADVFDNQETDGSLNGVPVSNGVCEGIVHIVDSPQEANKLRKGEIMVAKFTDIGWSPYYSIVNGLVTEIGSSLSHGAVVAREYGLPTIVNVKGATKLLRSGDRIVMDATHGTIRFV